MHRELYNTLSSFSDMYLIKSESKDMYNVTKDFHFKYCILFYFFLLIKKNQFPQKY